MADKPIPAPAVAPVAVVAPATAEVPIPSIPAETPATRVVMPPEAPALAIERPADVPVAQPPKSTTNDSSVVPAPPVVPQPSAPSSEVIPVIVAEDGLPPMDERNSIINAAGDQVRVPGAHAHSWAVTHKVRATIFIPETATLEAGYKTTVAMPYNADSDDEAAVSFAISHKMLAVEYDKPTEEKPDAKAYGIVAADQLAESESPDEVEEGTQVVHRVKVRMIDPDGGPSEMWAVKGRINSLTVERCK